MSFFSSLKTAYDSIGSEISKTFDSSDFENESKKSHESKDTEQVDIEDKITTPENKTRPPPDEPSVYSTPSASGGGEAWGEWETTPTRSHVTKKATPTQPPVKGTTSPLATSTPAKGKSSLENLSRDDLIKYVKKQAQLLQKTKAKCEELSRECEELKKVSSEATPPDNVTTPSSDVMEELMIVRSERDRAVGENRSLKQSLTELTTQKQDLSDQVTALTEANSKLKDFCEQHQSHDTEAANLRRTVTELTEQLESSQQQLCDSKGTADQLRERLEAAEQQKSSNRSQVSSLEAKLAQLTTEHAQILSENETLNNQLSDSNTKLQDLQHMVQNSDTAQAQLTDALSRLESTQAEMESAHRSSKSLECELTALKTQSESLQATNDQLSTELGILKHSNQTLTSDSSETARLQDECSRLTQLAGEIKGKLEREKDDLKTDLEREREAHKDECSRLTQLADKVKGQLEREKNDLKTDLEREREVHKDECSRLTQLADEVKGQLEREKNDLKTNLEREREVHKDETKKLKAFVLKLKRELKEKEGTEGAEQLHVAVENLTTEKEGLQAKLIEEEQKSSEMAREIEELTSKLTAAQSSATESSEQLRDKVVSLEESLELMRAELSTAQADLATAQSQVNTHQLTVDKLKHETGSLSDDLNRERQAHSTTRDKLTAAEKGVKSSELMNLELEDYQRSIRSLEEEIAGRGVKLENVNRESQLHVDKIQQLQKELESRGAQQAQEAETVTKLKALLVKNKRELSDVRKRESELEGKLEELTSTLEQERGEAEVNKVQLSEMSGQLQSVQVDHEGAVEGLQCTVRGLELRVAGLQTELSSTQASLTLVQGEYDSYKVRVHSVLKQKTTAAEQVDINPEIKKGYEDDIGRLKAELSDVRSQLSSTLSAHEELLAEHTALTTRHDQLLQEAQTTRERLQLRVRDLEAQHSRETREQGELVEQLRREMEELTSAFTTQISGLQLDHKRVVVGLREELHSTHSQLSRLQEEADSQVRPANQEQRSVVKPKAPPTETRTSGVGMDRTELESSYPSTPLSHEDSTVSLERLLSVGSQHEGDTAADVGQLQRQLSVSGHKVDHLTELLRESEASSVRLSEQAKLLKEEIRRLERNQEREGVSNMEYLKNVVLKFLHTQDLKEKTRLIPVITKLLQLSPQEVQFIQDTLRGEEVDGPPGAAVTPQGGGGAASKLTNYIHRWTGY